MELFTPEIGLVFWMFVAFILLFLVLAKWCWPMIIKMMDKRASTIDRGVEDARQAREQLDNAPGAETASVSAPADGTKTDVAGAANFGEALSNAIEFVKSQN